MCVYSNDVLVSVKLICIKGTKETHTHTLLGVGWQFGGSDSESVLLFVWLGSIKFAMIKLLPASKQLSDQFHQSPTDWISSAGLVSHHQNILQLFSSIINIFNN